MLLKTFYLQFDRKKTAHKTFINAWKQNGKLFINWDESFLNIVSPQKVFYCYNTSGREREKNASWCVLVYDLFLPYVDLFFSRWFSKGPSTNFNSFCKLKKKQYLLCFTWFELTINWKILLIFILDQKI